MKGIPGLGAGLIYPINLDDIIFSPNKEMMDFIKGLPRSYGMDIAYTSGVTAVLWGAYDEVSDAWYLYDEHYIKGQPAPVHVQAIKARGDWVWGVIDPSAEHHLSSMDSTKIIDDFIKRGLYLKKADNSLWAGITECYERFVTGRIKISVKCEKLIWELKQYRKDIKGKIVDKDDHACDALRYLIMSGKHVLTKEPEKDYEEEIGWKNYEPRHRDKWTGY